MNLRLVEDMLAEGSLRRLCGFSAIPSRSIVMRFEHRIDFRRLKRLINRAMDDLVRGLIRGLRVT